MPSPPVQPTPAAPRVNTRSRAPPKPFQLKSLLFPATGIAIFACSFAAYAALVKNRATDSRDRLRKRENPSPL